MLSEDTDEADQTVPVGSYVVLCVRDVPRYTVEKFLKDSQPGNDGKRPVMVVYSMLPHENKMSVLNFAVKRFTGGPQDAIK